MGAEFTIRNFCLASLELITKKSLSEIEDSLPSFLKPKKTFVPKDNQEANQMVAVKPEVKFNSLEEYLARNKQK